MQNNTRRSSPLWRILYTSVFIILGILIIVFAFRDNSNSPRVVIDKDTPSPSSTPFGNFNPIKTRSQPTPETNPTLSPVMPTTTPLEQIDIEFAVIGDYGESGSPERKVTDLILGWQPDFIITTGDNNYPDGAFETIDENIGQYFSDYIYPYVGEFGEGAEINRFFPTLGNHDWITQDAAPYIDYFELPGNERYYDFVWGPVHFYALDSDSREPGGVGVSSSQAQWLRTNLETSHSSWNVVYFHHAPFSSAYHGSTDWMQWPFEEWGADLVFAGHDHAYERLSIGGIPYITIGLSGSPYRYYFGLPIDGSEIRYRARHGAVKVSADMNSMEIQFINIDGKVIDEIALTNAQPLPDATSFPSPEEYHWSEFAVGFTKPVAIENAGDGSNRLFIVEQRGIVHVIEKEKVLQEPFLDIQSLVGASGNEQGLLGLTFDPQFTENGYFYINYTNTSGNTVISRFSTLTMNNNKTDLESEEVILTIPQPYSNHNGGDIEFGPDGMLYIATGDGGSSGDPENNAQNPQSLLGKLLRIDIQLLPYQNPEIIAVGLRNPWRFTFDNYSNSLFIADVGQENWEEVNLLPLAESNGVNFGWKLREGAHTYSDSEVTLELTDPIGEYSHAEGCSITGGEVYRGDMAAWQGIYIFGDYCSGNVWGLLNQDGDWIMELLFRLDAKIASFGTNEMGDIFLVDHHGRILTLMSK